MTQSNRRVFVAATYDTKGHEAEYVVDLLKREGLDAVSYTHLTLPTKA